MTRTDTPRSPSWQTRSKISQLIDRHLGREWSPAHYRLAHRMYSLWENGDVHYLELERWLLGQMPRCPGW